MTKEKLEDVKKEPANADQLAEKVKFISTDEEEQDGNFEFLCCRGGMSPGGNGIGGRW
ncbi:MULTISPECIES: hypothetical protein [unclassified Leclercia]|jgi:hypothetical protein|uniref:hypothetical protein n=1 Tax=unclassified Leclercia TaxID=2627398 RepID=UPI00289C1D21|nr:MULTISPECIES: hypothetical protein [unclassified Leclercia]MDY0923373.1 hypothetical protein [Leclercia sp. CFBP8987]